MTVFSYTWNATFLGQPSDGEDINLGASRIRLLKSGLTERLVVDHSWAGDTEDGKHARVTLRAASSVPPVDADNGIALNVVVAGISELHWLNNVGQLVRLTNQGQPYNAFQDLAVGGTLTVTNSNTVAQARFGNDGNFYLQMQSGDPYLTMDVNTYITFNRTTRKFVFVVDSVAVASFPP
jgi:hypothetical protein